MLKIGITGNIASGKSQVEKILDNLGYKVFDSDKIAHEVLDEITDLWGYDVFSEGKIDRKKLGALVFSDKSIKEKLENLTHPKIKSKILEIFENNRNEDFVFVSVPLLYEAHFEDLFDRILIIYTDSKTQLKRLIKRNNLSQEDAQKRIDSQLPYEEKIKKADYVINNNSDLESLNKEVIQFIKKLQNYPL